MMVWLLCWVRLFSQDAGVVGRSITPDGIDHSVVGVLAPDFSHNHDPRKEDPAAN